MIVVTDLNFPSDDFQALLLLLALPEFEVVQIVATDGNTWAEEVAENVSATLSAHDRSDITVNTIPFPFRHAGRGRAYRSFRRGYKSFLGPYLKSKLPRSRSMQPSSARQGLDALAEALDLCEEKVVIVSLGPLYPIAALLETAPASASKVARIVAMAGKMDHRVNARADFNVWFDPFSAKTVFESEIEILLLPRNACEQCQIDYVTLRKIFETAPGSRRFVADIIGMLAQHGPSFPLIDTVVPLLMSDPSMIALSKRGTIHVRRKPLGSSGQTYFREFASGNVVVIDRIDQIRLKDKLLRLAGGLSESCESSGVVAEKSDFPTRTWLAQRLFERPFHHIAVDLSHGDALGTVSELSLDDLDELYRSAVSLANRCGYRLGHYHPPQDLADGSPIDLELDAMASAAGLLAELIHLDAVASVIVNGQMHGFMGISIPSPWRRIQLKRSTPRKTSDGHGIIEIGCAGPGPLKKTVEQALRNNLEAWSIGRRTRPGQSHEFVRPEPFEAITLDDAPIIEGLHLGFSSRINAI